MRENLLRKGIALLLFLMLFLVSTQLVNAETDYHNNSLVIIFGKSSYVLAGSLWWRLGLYIPLIKRNFDIIANKEGESLNVIVLKPNSNAFYLDNENVSVRLFRARGVFYWFGKSLMFNLSSPQPVFCFCRANSIHVTKY